MSKASRSENLEEPPIWCKIIYNLCGKSFFKLWLKLGATYYSHVLISKDFKMITFAESEWTLINKMHDFKECDMDTKPKNINKIKL